MADDQERDDEAGDALADLDRAMGSMMRGYGLDHEPIDMMAAAELLSDGKLRQVALDDVGDRCVSTVFMPYDMSMGRSPVPVLYESMIFDADGEIRRVERYATKDAALAGHERLVAWVRNPTVEEPDGRVDD